MIRPSITPHDAVALLNELAAHDPHAMRTWLDARVVCNMAIAQHPTVQVGVASSGGGDAGTVYMLGGLDILNGLFGTIEGGERDGFGCIMAHLGDGPTAVRFSVIPEAMPEAPTTPAPAAHAVTDWGASEPADGATVDPTPAADTITPEPLRELVATLEESRLCPADWFAIKFRRNANSLAAYYGAPVWLVGGALRDARPRDFDVRVVVSDADLGRLYGARMETAAINDYEAWEWKRAYDQLKRSRALSHRMMVPVDFQVQALHEVDRYTGARAVRLDTTPDWVFDAHWRQGIPWSPTLAT